MNVLGLENKTGKPSKFVLPPNIENLQKSKKLELLHEIAAKVVDGFIFQDSSHLVGRILTAEEKQELLQQQELTDDNKFPCRFPGCNKKYKYKKRRNTHELSHDPPFVADEPPVELTTAMPSPSLDKQHNDDDVYNYNCALMTYAMLVFNFLLKLNNYSCSSYPTRASYSGQVDEFRNPMKNELKTRPCLKPVFEIISNTDANFVNLRIDKATKTRNNSGLITHFTKQTFNLNYLLLTLNVTTQLLNCPKQKSPFVF